MSKPQPTQPHRRQVLQSVLGAPALAMGAQSGTGTRRDATLIARENRQPGADFQLTNVRLDKRGGFRSPSIEGYCSHQSVEAGQTLRIMVSTNPAARFTIDIFRMGYYGGQGARLMTTLGPFPGKVQPDPEIGPERLRECRWEPSTELKIPAGWPSGVYLGRLNTVPEDDKHHDWQSYIVFIVRDRRKADILFQCSDTTWQSYNRWPDNYSLYTDPRGSWIPGVSSSFDRPYGKYAQIFENPQSIGSGEFLIFEYPLCYWLEQQGYDVTYCSNADMLDPAQILRARLFLSVGHDEYWDVRQYDNAMAGVKAGVSQLYLSGNSIFGVTPFRPSSDGRPNRIISRTGRFGQPSELELKEFLKIPFPMNGPDESLLMGCKTPYPFNGGGDWICTKPDHWVFAGSGMKKGDRVRGLVGWEFHGVPADIPGLEVVAEGIALQNGVRPVRWTATIYPGPKKNFVFSASTVYWVQGMSNPPGHMLPWAHWTRPHGVDRRVQRITDNLIRRAIGKTT